MDPRPLDAGSLANAFRKGPGSSNIWNLEKSGSNLPKWAEGPPPRLVFRLGGSRSIRRLPSDRLAPGRDPIRLSAMPLFVQHGPVLSPNLSPGTRGPGHAPVAQLEAWPSKTQTKGAVRIRVKSVRRNVRPSRVGWSLEDGKQGDHQGRDRRVGCQVRLHPNWAFADPRETQ
jgi:hypothetical protein